MVVKLGRWFEVEVRCWSLFSRIGRGEVFLCRGFSAVGLIFPR